MGSAVLMRADYSAAELRRLARRSKDTRQSSRLLSLAAVRDGMSRAEAARIGGMDRQTLRDWVHRFNEAGPNGLRDSWSSGPRARLSPEQLAELAEVVETGPDPALDGVVRWRRIDLKKVIEDRFGVAYHERHVSTLLKRLGFSHVSARPRHPAQDAKIVEAFKKTFPAPRRRTWRGCRPPRRSRSGSKTKPGSARRTAWCGNGQGAVRDRPPINATRAPTCLAPFARRAALAPRLPCRTSTQRPCSFISTRSAATS